ncbi:transposase family protein [Acinetobacter baumannii 1412924]|uniref:ISL3 family transposase n=1 Tax=Acinetobacter baumannii TaxID=470 RepID=UPI00044D3328|nr:ISL3 family transposase [Acinetobacter baumannii]EXH48336.1 transposase family protein [Acinetobacter baumannii 1412924]
MLDILQLEGVKPTDIRSENGSIVISIEPLSEAMAQHCPNCGNKLYKHGSRVNRFADTPQQMQPVILEVTRNRYRCSECKSIFMPEFSFLDDKRRATSRLIDAIKSRCLNQTFTYLAEETGLAINTIKNITSDYIEELEQTIKFETPSIMGIDELNLAGGVRCVITNIGMRSLYDMLPDRRQDTLKPYFKNLPDDEKVEWVCTDMWRPFKRSFQSYLPNATLVIDKFHVVRMASEMMERERKQMQNKFNRVARLHAKKNLRWLTLKRPDSLNEEELAMLEDMAKTMPQLKLAYDVKEGFYKIYDCESKEEAEKAFHTWADNIPSDLPQFHDVAKTVANHYDDIFAYWDAPFRITNAYTEGHNGLTKVANRLGRGYSFEVIRAKMLYNKTARSVTAVSTKASPSKELTINTDKPIKAASVNDLDFKFSNGYKKIKTEYGAHIPTLVEIYEDESEIE